MRAQVAADAWLGVARSTMACLGGSFGSRKSARTLKPLDATLQALGASLLGADEASAPTQDRDVENR